MLCHLFVFSGEGRGKGEGCTSPAQEREGTGRGEAAAKGREVMRLGSALVVATVVAVEGFDYDQGNCYCGCGHDQECVIPFW